MNNLREEFEKFIKQYKHLPIMAVEVWQIADWWIQKLEEREGEILKQIEGMYKEAKTVRQFMAKSGTGVGYNQALSDIKALFTNH